MNILYINSPIYDYLTATLIEGLRQLGHNVACSEASNYGEKLADEKVPEFAERADLIVVGSNVGVRSSLVQGVRNSRKVFVDGSDNQECSVVTDIRFKVVFKRELNRCLIEAAEQYILPLPFAAELRYFSDGTINKDLLVTFLANMRTNPLRYSVHQRLRNLRNPQIISGTTNERSYSSNNASANAQETPNYRQLLQRSLISVNVAGAGYDCARFWEILAARAMLFTQESDIIIPDGFTDGVDCVTFRSLPEFEEKMIYYLSRLELVKEIAERGHQRLLAHHTSRARAEYFLTQVARHILRPGYCEQFLHPKIRALDAQRIDRGIDVERSGTKTTPDCTVNDGGAGTNTPPIPWKWS